MEERMDSNPVVVWCRGCGWRLRAIERSLRRLGHERGFEAAATIAFFTVFSFFPLMLILVAAGSSLVESVEVQDFLLDAVLRLVPVSRDLVRQNLLSILEARGTVSIVGTLGLLWAATSALAALVRNLNRAWPDAGAQNMFVARLRSLGLVAFLTGLWGISLFSRAAGRLLPDWRTISSSTVFFLVLARVPSTVVFYVFLFVSLLFFYYWVPARRVRARDAAVGALVATALFRLATYGFAFYLRSGFARYNVVYGSLGALLALLSWVYLLCVIVLYGAHLSAALDHERPVREEAGGGI